MQVPLQRHQTISVHVIHVVSLVSTALSGFNPQAKGSRKVSQLRLVRAPYLALSQLRLVRAHLRGSDITSVHLSVQYSRIPIQDGYLSILTNTQEDTTHSAAPSKCIHSSDKKIPHGQDRHRQAKHHKQTPHKTTTSFIHP
jgi:hypothetical protein